jgi:hypothetical protein
MNNSRIAQLRISPLHIQQGLFVSLALLITLIVGQQFERWDSHRNVHQIKQSFMTGSAYTNVSAAAPKDVALSLQPVEGETPVSERPHPQSWVF